MVRVMTPVLVLEVEKEGVEERAEKEAIFENVSVEANTEEKEESTIENDITSFILSRIILSLHLFCRRVSFQRSCFCPIRYGHQLCRSSHLGHNRPSRAKGDSRCFADEEDVDLCTHHCIALHLVARDDSPDSRRYEENHIHPLFGYRSYSPISLLHRHSYSRVRCVIA